MRLRDMKKLFIALAAVALTACVKAPEKTVKVYAWQGEGGNTTEQTLQADFSKWHAHGVDGMCYNAGHDTEKIQRAAKACLCQWHGISRMDSRHVATWIGLHPLRREPERRVGRIPYRRMCLITNACARTKKARRSSCWIYMAR